LFLSAKVPENTADKIHEDKKDHFGREEGGTKGKGRKYQY
jgi:hypothetical protein